MQLRPAQDGSPLVEKLARHLQWSAAISGAFLRADGPSRWHPATFTFGPGAKRVLSLVRQVLNFRLSVSPRQQTVAITNNFLKQQVNAAGDRSLPAGRSAGWRIPDQRGTRLAFGHNHLLQTYSHVQKFSRPRIWFQPPAGSAPPAHTLPAKTISSAMRRVSVTPEVSAEEMTTRITRRLNRVEVGPLSPETRLAPFASATHGFGGKLENLARRPHSDVSAVHHSENAAAIPIASAVNVAQLTDEVMRQLDRRLVAVRERIGKT